MSMPKFKLHVVHLLYITKGIITKGTLQKETVKPNVKRTFLLDILNGGNGESDVPGKVAAIERLHDCLKVLGVDGEVGGHESGNIERGVVQTPTV